MNMHQRENAVRAGRMAMYHDLAAALAHEINNPVYAARLALALLGQDLRTEGHDLSYLVIAEEELRRVAAILDRLRQSAQEAEGIEPTTLDGLIDEVAPDAE